MQVAAAVAVGAFPWCHPSVDGWVWAAREHWLACAVVVAAVACHKPVPVPGRVGLVVVVVVVVVAVAAAGAVSSAVVAVQTLPRIPICKPYNII